MQHVGLQCAQHPLARLTGFWGKPTASAHGSRWSWLTLAPGSFACQTWRMQCCPMATQSVTQCFVVTIDDNCERRLGFLLFFRGLPRMRILSQEFQEAYGFPVTGPKKNHRLRKSELELRKRSLSTQSQASTM